MKIIKVNTIRNKINNKVNNGIVKLNLEKVNDIKSIGNILRRNVLTENL